MTKLAAPAIAAVEQGRVRFTPPKWGEVYLNWMREIRPWCVSRQLWWGHQLPVWYRGEEVHVGREAPEGEGWVRDEDVLDTWFSSALWPFATLGWPEQTPELERFYPTQVLSTARDIIFLWVARMVMMGVEYMGEEPFSDVYIHSVVQAADGRRMSKSLGTGIDPIEQIDLHGADALRFGLLMMSSTQDVRFSRRPHRPGPPAGHQALERRRAWWSTAAAGPGIPAPEPVTLADRWIVSRISAAVEQSRVTDRGLPALAAGRPRLPPGLRRLLRLVPRAAEGRRGHPGGGRPRARAGAGAGPPADALRHRGVLVAHAGRRGPDGGPPAGRRPRARPTPRPRPRSPRSRRS